MASTTILAHPTFKPVFCPCIGSGRMYDDEKAWKQHIKNSKTHHLIELKKTMSNQQQIITRLENDKSQLKLRVSERDGLIRKHTTERSTIVTRAKGEIDKLKTMTTAAIAAVKKKDRCITKQGQRIADQDQRIADQEEELNVLQRQIHNLTGTNDESLECEEVTDEFDANDPTLFD